MRCLINFLLVRRTAAHPLDVILAALAPGKAVTTALEKLPREEARVNLICTADTSPA